MSTRKLILTALVCGLVIMLAGGAKLFMVVRDEPTATLNKLGISMTLSDMTVSVDKVTQDASGTYVQVSMKGVEDANAVEGWRVLASGTVLAPAGAVPASVGVACDTTKVASLSRCVVAFPATQGSVTVAYLRAGAQSQWAA